MASIPARQRTLSLIVRTNRKSTLESTPLTWWRFRQNRCNSKVPSPPTCTSHLAPGTLSAKCSTTTVAPGCASPDRRTKRKRVGCDVVVSACDRRLGELTGVEQRTYTVDANRGGRREFCFESSKGFTALRRLRVGL